MPSGYFLHFAGGFFVEMDGPNFYKCLDTGSCSGVAPLQYADGNSGCHIAQYFGEGEAECTHVKTSRRNFLLHTGQTIVHALLDPMTLRLSCDHKGKDSIRNVTGRGVTDIPQGCKVNTNKAIFPVTKPERIVIERNLSLGRPISVGKIPFKHPTRGTPSMRLIPLPEMDKRKYEIQNGYLWIIITLSCIIGVILVILVGVLLYFPYREKGTKV